ncbi:MAG: glycosyltransferase family 9 protein, partial [Motiliproteus sp.]|nr:glycosyltransferase family 9 protein [Motiliproteus sp.]
MTLTKPIQLPLNRAPKSICILRLSALGDVCNLVPTVRALQRQWPNCRITWILGKTELQLLQGLEGVELIPYDKKSGIKGMLAIRQQLQGHQFDVLLHMQQAIRASLLSLFISARYRVGFDPDRAKDYQHRFTRYHIPPHAKAHVLEGFLDFAHVLGVNPQPLTWNIPIPEAAREQAATLKPDGSYLLLSPCSNQRARNFRNWLPEGYGQVIDYAYEKHGLTTLMTGGTTDLEKSFGEQISD